MKIMFFNKLANWSFAHYFLFYYSFFLLYPKISSTSSALCCSENTSVAIIPFLSLSIKMFFLCCILVNKQRSCVVQNCNNRLHHKLILLKVLFRKYHSND